MRGQRPARLSIRARLSLLYGGALFAAGFLQLAAIYAIVRQRLSQPFPSFPGTESLPRPQLPPELMAYIDDYRYGILRDLITQSAIALVIIGVGASLLGWWLAGRALAPIDQITQTAARVSSGALDERIALQGPRDEVRALADTFDAMLDRLERAFDSQQRFVANASHELRTPLATERTILEVALADETASDDLKAIGAQLLDVHARSERLIDGLLTLARGDQPHAQESVDLADLAASATAICVEEARACDITVITDLNPSVLTGDPDLLDRLVLNLIQNAIRHNQPGGWLSITTDTIDRASQYPVAQLRVENSGRPVHQDDIDTLFEPFRRGQDRTGQGVGLGLSIVKAIATAHGGTVKGVAHVTNGGLLVIVDLPVRNAVRPGIAT